MGTYFRFALIGKDWKHVESQSAHMLCLSFRIRRKKARTHWECGQFFTIVSGGAGGNSPQPQPPKNTSVSVGSKPLSMPDSVLTTATTDFGVTRGYLPPPA